MASGTVLVRVFRSGLEESVHLGHVAVCDVDGHLVAWAGDPHRTVFARSCMKPVQAAVSLGSIPDPWPRRGGHAGSSTIARASTRGWWPAASGGAGISRGTFLRPTPSSEGSPEPSAA